MKNHKLGSRSLRRLRGIHPDLVRVVKRALKICSCDFTVIEGRRTLERQKRLLQAGASKTLRSRHLTGHAVDIAPWNPSNSNARGWIDWNDYGQFCQVGHAMRVAAMDLDVPMIWGAGKMYGGAWSNKFNDMPHFQLKWKEYPR